MRPMIAPPLHRDPAPSRAAYRLHRLWLTPLFRATLRVGLPAFFIVFALGLYFANPDRRTAIGDWAATLRTSVEQRPEFMVSSMRIEGASPEVSNALRAMVPVQLPISSFNLDLGVLQSAFEGFDAVAGAELQIRTGGLLHVTIRQRTPALVWRSRSALELLDATGHRVASIAERSARADLPLVAGDSADKAVPEALALLSTAGPLGPRVRGLVRIGERRWDLVLDRGQRILLPETQPIPALERVIALDKAQGLLARAIVQVDLRLPHRPTIRLAVPAASVDPEALTEAKATTP